MERAGRKVEAVGRLEQAWRVRGVEQRERRQVRRAGEGRGGGGLAEGKERGRRGLGGEDRRRWRRGAVGRWRPAEEGSSGRRCSSNGRNFFVLCFVSFMSNMSVNNLTPMI